MTVFRQRLVRREPGCTITLMRQAEHAAPVQAAGRVILEPGAPVVWFTFDDAWHDIGRFHTAGGRFTGYYANVLTPVEFITPLHWSTTDLCLDIWLDRDGGVQLLDEDEFERAVASGAIDAITASTARAEADGLLMAARAGTWPPQLVDDWPLERVRDTAAHGTTDENAV